MDKTFKTEVTDGSLDLKFNSSINNAKISAIEIQPSTIDNAVNNAPIIDLNGDVRGRSISTPVVYASGVVSSVAITDDSLKIFESDTATLAGATVTITNPQDGELESLNAVATGNITVDYDPNSSNLTLSGNDTITNYQQVLRSVTYSNSAPNPDTTQRELSFVVDDEASVNNFSQSATATVDVLPVEPVLGVGASRFRLVLRRSNLL